MDKEQTILKEKNQDTILKYIEDILINNRFQRIVDVEEVCSNILEDTWRIYGPKTGAYEQYLVVVNLNQNSIGKLKKFLFQQEHLYTELRKQLKGTFDKNVSLLLCVRNATIEYSEEEIIGSHQQNKSEMLQEKSILKIEEDPYYFKKLVLTYMDSEVDILQEKSQTLGFDAWGLLQAKLSEMKNSSKNSEMEDYDKDEYFERNSQDILLRMCIKLPFISVDLEQTGNMENIFEKVKKQIEDKEECRIWDFINEVEINSIKEFKNINEKEQEKLLNLWMPEKESEKN